MAHRTFTKVASIALAVGCVALLGDTAHATDGPKKQKHATTAEARTPQGWVHPYWDMYGLISDGSMWNPEAFSSLDDRDQIARVQRELELVRAVEPTQRAEDVDVVVDPTLSAACGIEQPQVYFAFDSAQLRDDSEGTLEPLASCLSKPPMDDAYLSITGHADPQGPEEYNSELGLDRADAVADALAELGVDADRIDTYSRGEALAGDAAGEWPRARRVVIALDR